MVNLYYTATYSLLPHTYVNTKKDRYAHVYNRGGACVCVLRMEPLFLPVDIAAHTQWPCWLFFLLIEEIQAR